jgi:flagellum-specific ATP synthase
LDGHIVLSRELAMQNHYPAIDVLKSVSRIMIDVIDERHRNFAGKLRKVLATYKKAEDLINIGAYAKGSNADIDYAIHMIEHINNYLKQDLNESTSFSESVNALMHMFGK